VSRRIRIIKFLAWTPVKITEGENAGDWKVVLHLDNNPFLNQGFQVISLVDDYDGKFDRGGEEADRGAR
jgi:hypothetical protein